MKLNPGAVSLRGFVLWIECRFTSQTPPPSFWWGCSFLLPQSTSIIQGYKCFFIYIRACHRSRILNIKHTVGTFVRLQSNHGIDTLTRRVSSEWKRNSEGTALTETLYPHLCFAKLFSCMTFSSLQDYRKIPGSRMDIKWGLWTVWGVYFIVVL